MSSEPVAVSLPAALGAHERRVLEVVLDMIISPSPDGTRPGASRFDVWGHACEADPRAAAAIRADLDEVTASARERFGEALDTVSESDLRDLVEALRAGRPRFLAELARQTAACYYQQDEVLLAIGMEPRPPHPGGYEVDPGDLSLLDPVRARGKVYRDV